MAKGDKDKYTDKQKRKAEHIEESYEDRGVSQEEADRVWDPGRCLDGVAGLRGSDLHVRRLGRAGQAR